MHVQNIIFYSLHTDSYLAIIAIIAKYGNWCISL